MAGGIAAGGWCRASRITELYDRGAGAGRREPIGTVTDVQLVDRARRLELLGKHTKVSALCRAGVPAGSPTPPLQALFKQIVAAGSVARPASERAQAHRARAGAAARARCRRRSGQLSALALLRRRQASSKRSADAERSEAESSLVGMASFAGCDAPTNTAWLRHWSDSLVAALGGGGLSRRSVVGASESLKRLPGSMDQ